MSVVNASLSEYWMKTGPEIFVRSQQVAVLSKDAESHSVRMRLQYLIPAPYHIPVHIIVYALCPAQKKRLGFKDGCITRGDGATVYRFRIRTCWPEVVNIGTL
jgi:hypothetical protein